jgi:hypothetical protein
VFARALAAVAHDDAQVAGAQDAFVHRFTPGS